MSTTKNFDLNPFTELTTSELHNITGGYWGEGVVNWGEGVVKNVEKGAQKVYGAVSGGVKRAGQGIKDGSSNAASRYDDLWYNLGYGGGEYLGR